MGSFRGGKRGGSRTAHLKAASAQPCKSQTQASTKALQADPSHDSPPAPSDPTSSHHPHAAALDSSTGWADDSDAVISESEAEGEEVAQDVQQHMNSSDQPEDEELKFEVDVVDTLGDLSQPSALSGDVVDAQQPLPGSSSQMQVQYPFDTLTASVPMSLVLVTNFCDSKQCCLWLALIEAQICGYYIEVLLLGNGQGQ